LELPCGYRWKDCGYNAVLSESEYVRTDQRGHACIRFVDRSTVGVGCLLFHNANNQFDKGCRVMGFAWIVTEIITAWVCFVLGRKYQDMSDILMARRIAKLLEKRKAVQNHQEAFEQAEREAEGAKVQ
jgi:hypothetical protein